MTKVQISFKLARALTDDELASLSHVHAVYGIFVARLAPSLDELFIEYDAARMSPKEIRGMLEQHGLSLV